MSNPPISSPGRILDEFDVVVVGGGPGGVGAAVRASEQGAKTLLIERHGSLGGAATGMLVNPFMPATTVRVEPDKPRVLLNGGLVEEIANRLAGRAAGGFTPSGCTTFDDEMLKVILDEIVAEAGVKVLYHATLFDAQTENGRVRSIRLAHNGGPITVKAKVFIDATGDALLAERAGAEILFGNEEGVVMPMTLFFVVGGVDYTRFPKFHEVKALMARGAEDDPPLINTNISCWHTDSKGLLYVNAIRVTGNTIDPFDLSAAETEGRRRVENLMAWLRAHIPAFEKAWLVKTAPHIGIRESRRVRGEYLLTGDDFQSAAKFEDAIACSAYPVDIHGQKQGETRLENLGPGEYYQIPFRCLIPRGLSNLLVASRSISADVVMHSSLRCMPTIYNVGEAAGFAAAMSLPSGETRAVKIAALQKKIRASAGILEPRAFHPNCADSWPG